MICTCKGCVNELSFRLLLFITNKPKSDYRTLPEYVSIYIYTGRYPLCGYG